MHEEPLTADELLDAWHDASRAAQLTDRLSQLAAAAVVQADVGAEAAEQVAALAERTAEAALAASERARATAGDARSRADVQRDQAIPAAIADTEAIAVEQHAREAYEQEAGPTDGSA